MTQPPAVIPAKAGIHFDFAVAFLAAAPPPSVPLEATAKWIPAFAGMTGWVDSGEVEAEVEVEAEAEIETETDKERTPLIAHLPASPSARPVARA
ncbi:hypothetical protein [Pseudomonas sp. CGJS7]|uniref:hypothetical protein n=1 Tax=Pseudomonas sp. CGJS7 TaxID=3109348 RepID=UPI003008588D